MDYRRLYIPGGTFFFTLVTYNRLPIFNNPSAIDLLHDAFRYTMARWPFSIVASVILPDHMHFIWTLPSDSCDYSTRWRLIKSHFTRNWSSNSEVQVTISRQIKGEANVWQRRFWEHFIRDENDLTNHVEYIHYNPVKHGLVNSPKEWQYSSFQKYVKDGLYALEWGAGIDIFNGHQWME